MSGNTLGTLFAVTNFGESHGPAIGCVIDGCPPGMALSEADIQHDLDRRRPGTSRHVTQRQEPDQVQILSGVYQGVTTGAPIALLIQNTDQRSQDYGDILQTFRPGHADYTYLQKYGVRDPRGGGRSSARLTAPTVAAGAVAKKWLLEKFGTTFKGCMTQLGEHPIGFEDWSHVTHNPFYAPVADVSHLENYMDSLRKAGDSCGARIRVVAQHMPVGLGQPIYDRLDADIAFAMMGLNAVKGVEMGAGFASVAQRGSTHGDSLTPEGFEGNNAGGVLGGISTGQDLEVSIAIKPTSSIMTPRDTINSDGTATQVQTKGRHDPCVGIRATPIAEALLALVVMDHALRHRAQCGDVVMPLSPIRSLCLGLAQRPQRRACAFDALVFGHGLVVLTRFVVPSLAVVAGGGVVRYVHSHQRHDADERSRHGALGQPHGHLGCAALWAYTFVGLCRFSGDGICLRGVV